ncbi:hypothetical protein [Flexithrix dorotheae]|uniref:hypothetical protein n=1 Tax=Flexithrix dorotheae TaxID=70993 RepID=UPI000360F92B|nr:hypothetical protein [Flexithrix dorotheae]
MDLQYQNDYITVSYDLQQDIVYNKWFAQTMNMDEDTFKQEIKKLADTFRKIQPQKAVSNGQDFFFTINVDLQQWVALDFNDCIAPFSALVVSRELLAQLSLEQTAEEIKRKTDVFIKYFDNENKAFNWVKSIKVHTNFNQE